jgi:hypothetical protein
MSELSKLQVHGPRALLQAVPYLLGFHPADSLVVVGVGAGTVRVTARLDLDDLVHPDSLRHTMDVLARSDTESVIAVVYDDAVAVAEPPLPWAALLPQILDAATAAGCVLMDMFLVSAGRWWSYACDGPQCCPDAGGSVADPTTAFAASATVAGLSALPSRAALAAVLQPHDAHERERLAPLIATAENGATTATLEARTEAFERAATRALFAAARHADAGGRPVRDAAAARLGAALTITAVRDSAWIAVDGDRLDGRPLWADLARRLPSPYDAAALFLYGWCCWRHGDGVSAHVAVERALSSDPSYTAADMLQVALARGMDPRAVPRLRRSDGRRR